MNSKLQKVGYVTGPAGLQTLMDNAEATHAVHIYEVSSDFVGGIIHDTRYYIGSSEDLLSFELAIGPNNKRRILVYEDMVSDTWDLGFLFYSGEVYGWG